MKEQQMKLKPSLTALLVLSLLMLSGCGTPPATTTAQPPATSAAAEAPAEPSPAMSPASQPAGTNGEKTKISYWFSPPEGGEATTCFVETAVTSFNAQSATVEVEAVPQPKAWDATRTALAGQAGPDIIVTPGPSFAFELAKANQLLPLDAIAEKYRWSERLVPWALNLGKVNGQLVSIPTELETLVLYYNKTLFDQKGWTPPNTIEEMMALAEKIQAEGIIPFAHANAEWRPTNEWYVGEFMNHVAGPQKVYDALTGKGKWTDPELVRSVELLNEAQQRGYFMGGLDRYYTATNAERYAAFGNGEAAMNIEGSWFLNEVGTYFGEKAGNTNEWAWVPVPSQSGDDIFDLGIGTTYSINKATKHPDAVAEYFDYLFSPATQGKLLAACSAAPAPIRLQANAMQGLDPRVSSLYEALGKASDANNYGYTTWTFWPSKSDTYLYEEVEKLWAKELTAQQYLEGLQTLFDQEAQQGDVPPIPSR
jgi:raffinose/stachyose/melibiose transport system substrate-binding protein